MTKEKLPLLKDTTKQFLNLPGEIKLDILKFLKFNQLLSLQQTNYYFYCLIRQNEGILACRRLYAVKPIMDNSKDLSEQDFFKIESGIFNILLNDQLVERWQSAVDSRIPVYLSLCDTPPNNKLYTRVDMSEVEDHYMLKLPVYPKTTEEMKIVRCWLEKLFLCTFECAEFTDYFFNPEMIKILFENEENIPTQFRSERVEIVYCNVNIKNALRFTLDHLIINQLRIFFASFDKKEKCNKYLLDLLNNGGKNIISIWISLETRKLINLILMHIMTQDCSNFVSCIIIDFFSAPEINSDQNTEKSFTITNTYNSNVIFDLDWNGDKLVIFKKEEESSF